VTITADTRATGGEDLSKNPLLVFCDRGRSGQRQERRRSCGRG